jgi:hypothetical protein
MSKTNALVDGGLFTALSVIFIYLSNIIPLNRLYLLGIASCFIPISILVIGIKKSILVYVSTSLICFMIINNKLNLIAYILFFGLYGIEKYYIEKINYIIFEYILKILIFNISLFIIYGLLYYFKIMPDFRQNLYVIVVFAEVVFILFDYVMTLFIHFISIKFKRFMLTR